MTVVLVVDVASIGIAFAAISGGVAAIITAIGSVLTVRATARKLDVVVDKQVVAEVKADEIHTLVNSNMTAIRAQLAAAVADRDQARVQLQDAQDHIANTAPNVALAKETP